MAVLLLASTLLGADVNVTYPDGTPKEKYAVDADNRKDGAYVEFHPNGKTKVKASYAAGELDGTFTSFHENGKTHVSATYRKGKLQGAYKELNDKGQILLTSNHNAGQLHGWRVEYDNGRPVTSQYYKSGELLLPRGPDQIKRQLADIMRAPAPGKNADVLLLERQEALRRLKAYRYLCGVPYENLELDDELQKYAQAGARLCERIGGIEHRPVNPGLPEDEYKLGYKGTSHSNLCEGTKFIWQSIDEYLDDSDATNRDAVGHRRWCLNPALKKTGFGKSGKFFAMWSMDQSQEKIPDYDFVCFPPRGLMPTTHFKPAYMWSISVNPKKYAVPDGNVKVTVYAADKDYNRIRNPLPLTYFHVDRSGCGIPNCIIFQPQLTDNTTGLSRFWVEVEGIKDKKGASVPIRYLTEFLAVR